MLLRRRGYLVEEKEIKVDVVGFSSGQEPDDLDDKWGADMEVKGYIQGVTVARLLGVQQRVLLKTMEKLTERKALSLLTDGRNVVSKELLKLITPMAKKVAVIYAGEEFNKGAKIDDIEFGSSDDIWMAKINSRNGRIDFEIEIGVTGNWI